MLKMRARYISVYGTAINLCICIHNNSLVFILALIVSIEDLSVVFKLYGPPLLWFYIVASTRFWGSTTPDWLGV